MLLSTSIGSLRNVFSDEEMIRMIAEAGFDAYDLNLTQIGCDNGDRLNGPDALRCAKEMRAIGEAAGVVCNQSHAPFPSSTGDAAKDAEIFTTIVRSMEIAAAVGAKNIVVHPKQHLSYASDPDAPERLFEMNLEFYTALIPYCKSFGIRVAVENMWQYRDDAGHIGHSTCSTPEEFVRYLDALNSEWMVACLDIGHAALVGEDMSRMMNTLGSKRLQALHVHDVIPDVDLHTLPYQGTIPYRKVTAALAECGYEGDLTYEADRFFAGVPNELIPQTFYFMWLVGRRLIREIQSASAARKGSAE